jgi:hypothetical protein
MNSKRIYFNSIKYPNTYTIVDVDDYDELVKYTWSIIKPSKTSDNTYAQTIIRKDNRYHHIYMHRLVMQLNGFDISNRTIDHADGNQLNNSKSNLRFCSVSENNRNKHKSKTRNSSMYKGVYFHKATGKFQSRIKFDRKDVYLGEFYSEVEAAIMYNKKALELYGEFACLNVIEGEI